MLTAIPSAIAVAAAAPGSLADRLPTAEDFEEEYEAKVEAFIEESRELLESTAEWLVDLLDKSAPDVALQPTVGVLVGLLNEDGPGAVIEKAAYALRIIAHRGTHASSIRTAGGIPALISVVRYGPDEWAAEQAAGALMHLCMQRAENREALRTAGGISALAEMLPAGPENQAAQYAANTLGVLAVTSGARLTMTLRTVHSAVANTVDDAQLAAFPELRQILAQVAQAAPTPGSPTRGASVNGTQMGWMGRLRARVEGWLGDAHADDAETEESYWTCPITHELFRDPVIASDGMTYERAAIREVLDSGNGLSPLTREPLSEVVYANFGLRQHIADYRSGATAGRSRASSCRRACWWRPARTAGISGTPFLRGGVRLRRRWPGDGTGTRDAVLHERGW